LDVIDGDFILTWNSGISNPEKIEEFAERINLIGIQAMLQGELSFGAPLMGIREYLKGKTPESADGALDASALHVLQILVDRTEEIRFNKKENSSD
jgi:hypothetical protein